MNILGISAFYHDSAATLIRDGKVIAAAQEERFTRKKHDHRFPKNAVTYCLREGGITVKDLDIVAFYEKPFVKFERLLESYLAYAPRGFSSFMKAIPLWMREKLWMKAVVGRELGYDGTMIFTEHHESHAASAFYPSPFPKAAFLTMDGVGEWSTTSFGVGEGNHLRMMADIKFPHSLGLLYSAFTYYTGFKVNSGEYKVMGLAPYGEPKYTKLIFDHLIAVKEDGSFRMNMEYFDYVAGLTMTNEKFHQLFGGPPRSPESKLTQREMGLARSLQDVTDEIVMRLARHVHRETKQDYLCLAGGVALNCVANGKLLREGPFKDIWIQPAAGDAGGSLGAALAAWHEHLDKPRSADGVHDAMQGAYLGPAFSDDDIDSYLKEHGIVFEKLDRKNIPDRVADLINAQNVVGWFEGRMEFGPRALGARSILGDARSAKMQETMNVKIKFRESFRPFAPSVLVEKVSDYFELDRPSPYMLLVANVQKDRRRKMTTDEEKLFGIEKLNITRSDIPAVTHIDYSARVQTVDRNTNPLYHELLTAFEKKYGCGVIINTSFNVRGEPIVCTPEDAYRCFMRTNMDYLLLGSYLLRKDDQKPLEQDSDWRSEFGLD